MQKLIILLLLWVSGSAYAQIGATESQIINRWKGGRPGTVPGSTRKQIYFPHGNHGCGVALEYVLDTEGTIKFEQWWSDCKLSPADVLKQSEPGYTWYSVDGKNWFGHGENTPGLHAFYRDTRSGHILDIARLVDAPDRGEGGIELIDLEGVSSTSLSQVGKSISATTDAPPFIGCKSDGQAVPLDAPMGQVPAMTLSSAAVQRLAYYKAENGIGVLAPRGWHGFSNYGSSGSSLFVSPEAMDAKLFSTSWKGFAGSRARWFESVPERSNAKDPLKVKEVWVKERRYIVCLNEEELENTRRKQRRAKKATYPFGEGLAIHAEL